MKGRYLS